jgi:predicted neutral ceramidase superfamily lipid hydrolase
MWKSIFLTTLIAGTCDIVAACTQAYIVAKILPLRILKYIASGVFGKSAYEGGIEMSLLGLVFHYMIAFACTAVFYWLYPKLSFLKFSLFLNTFTIGIVAWFVTTQMIIPISQITPAPFSISKVLMAISILIVCIGLPIAYRAKQFYGL